MSEPLQEFSWKKSNYERLNDSWVCGKLCQGTPCQLGPTSKGLCQGGNEPVTDGSRRPCQPKRSLRQKRRIATITGVAISLSVCLLLWNSGSSAVISPGPLTAHHSSSTMSCADCHSAAHDWTQTVFRTNTSIQDSMLCLKCHQGLGPEPLLAHSFSLETLEELKIDTAESPTNSPSLTLAFSSPLVNRQPNAERSCDVCHQEHHGRAYDLNRFTNLQCQSCHSDQFHSFKVGHPDFRSAYGNDVNGIQFDHASHMNQYFRGESQRLMPDATPPADCAACHIPNSAGRKMLTRGFEQMCSSCHSQGIQDQDFSGVPIFALPEINSEAVGEWPTITSGRSLTKLPAFMQLLLSLHAQELPANEIAWAIKEFFHEVSQKGERAIQDRLPAKWSQFGKLQPSIVPALLHAQQLWFPHLEAEMSKRNQGLPLPIQKQGERSEALFPLASDIGGGWSLSLSEHLIRYRPIGHADPVIKLLLEQSLKNRNNHSSEKEKQIVNEILEQLMNPTASGTLATQGPIASGRCLACHTVKQNSRSQEWKILWTSIDSARSGNTLTRFSHRPHLTNGFADQCSSCHKVDESRNSNSVPLLTAFERVLREGNVQQHSFSHGFAALSKMSCAECHNKQSQLDNCTQCHQYHATQREH